jgi:hypothetical protein
MLHHRNDHPFLTHLSPIGSAKDNKQTEIKNSLYLLYLIIVCILMQSIIQTIEHQIVGWLQKREWEEM